MHDQWQNDFQLGARGISYSEANARTDSVEVEIMTTTKIILTWNPERKTKPLHDTRVIIGYDFPKLSVMEKLDFLQDAIGELSMIYDGLLSSHNQGCIREPD